MTSNCNASPTNNFCTCDGSPDYLQYNADGLNSGQGAGNRCCNMIDMTPDILHRLPNMTEQIGSTSQYLDYFNDLEFTPCDYSKYFGGKDVGTSDADAYLRDNYHQLFTFAERQRIIYNTFYVYDDSFYPSSVTTASDLVPIVDGNTIRSPEGTMPLIFNFFDGVHSESQYLFVVWPTSKPLPQISFKHKFFYFYGNDGKDCKNNYCTTTHSASRGLSFSNTGPGNKGDLLPSDNTTTLGVAIGLGVLIFIFSAFLIWDSYSYKKKPIKETLFSKKPPPLPRGGV